MEKINIKIGWSGKNFSAIIENFGGVILATSKTLNGVKKEIESAFDFHVEGMIEDGDNIPAFINKKEYEFNFELLTSALLKALDGTITRSALAKATNINERQLGHYIQGKREARKSTREKVINGIEKLRNDLLEVV
jgi:predicted RNase H-like HicB family nuclease